MSDRRTLNQQAADEACRVAFSHHLAATKALDLMQEAADLIEQQTAEIERWHAVCDESGLPHDPHWAGETPHE